MAKSKGRKTASVARFIGTANNIKGLKAQSVTLPSKNQGIRTTNKAVPENGLPQPPYICASKDEQPDVKVVSSIDRAIFKCLSFIFPRP